MLTLFIQFATQNDHFWLKIVLLTLKMVENILEIICIFTAARNQTNNFADTHFGPDYCTTASVIP